MNKLLMPNEFVPMVSVFGRCQQTQPSASSVAAECDSLPAAIDIEAGGFALSSLMGWRTRLTVAVRWP